MFHWLGLCYSFPTSTVCCSVFPSGVMHPALRLSNDRAGNEVAFASLEYGG